MLYWLLATMLILIFDILDTIGVSDNHKDLEIILLRQQIRILQRTTNTPTRLPRPAKLILATLTARLHGMVADTSLQLQKTMLIFKPETVLGWHRALVRRKWTYRQRSNLGRPRLSAELEVLIVQFANENSSWGYDRIEGERRNLRASWDRL